MIKQDNIVCFIPLVPIDASKFQVASDTDVFETSNTSDKAGTARVVCTKTVDEANSVEEVNSGTH